MSNAVAEASVTLGDRPGTGNRKMIVDEVGQGL